MKKFFMLFFVLIITSFILACGDRQIKTGAPVSSNVLVNQLNGQLAKYPMGGFGYKSSKLPPQKWSQWAKQAAPVVKKILNQVPDGHVLQVRGHADASGPEDPEPGKPGNIALSKNRAKTVYNALKAQGITSNKLTYDGVGSAEPMEGVDPRSSRQRRVTFVIVEK